MHREPRFRNGVCMAACRKPKGWNSPKAIRPLQVMIMKRKAELTDLKCFRFGESSPLLGNCWDDKPCDEKCGHVF